MEESQLLEILRLIDKIDARLKKLESKIPDSFDIFYKPPRKKNHQKLNVVLDDIHHRLNNLEVT